MSQTKAQLIDPVDGTIVNADINASAAIAGSKIDPTFTSDLTIPDKIIHSGDTDTAIRFPAANVVSVETGGAETFRADGSQRLLVGTSTSRGIGGTANRKLQIEGTSINGLSLARNSSDDNPAFLSLGKSRSASVGGTTIVQDNDDLGEIQFCGADGVDLITRAATIRAKVDGTPGADDLPGSLIFSTTADGANAPTDRLLIDSSGNVGIGTTSPSALLHINSSDNNLAYLQSTDAFANIAMADTNGSVSLLTTLGRLDIKTGGDASTQGTNAITSMSILANGNVGIGTTNPSYPLDIQAASGDANMRLRSAGTDTSDDTIFRMQVAGTTQDNFIYFGDSADSNAGYLNYNHASDYLRIFVNAAERVRINSSGVLFVGCTSAPTQGDTGAAIPGNGIHIVARNTNSATNAVFRAFGGAGEFRTTGTGDAKNTNNSYAGTSDQELKENIVDANSQWDDIKALKVRNYNFKESTRFSTHKQIGVIAQELEASGMNGLVATNDDELYTENDTLPEGKKIGDVKEKGYKSVHYSVLYMKAIKALQEAMAKIETLETKVAALETA